MYRIFDSKPAIPPINNSNFIPRNRNGSIVFIILLFAIALIALFLLRYDFMLLISSFVIMLIPVSYTIYLMQKNIDIVTDSEFQNALFSSAFNKEQDFVFFSDSVGNIVQGAQSIKEYIPAIATNDAFNSIAEVAELSISEKERLIDVVNRSRHEHFLFSLSDDKGNKYKIRLTIEPIVRPSGYFLVRGRKFIEDRKKNDDVDYFDSEVRSSSKNPSSLLINNLPFGVYSTSPSGHIRAINSTLEQWLGYEKGDIVARELVLDDLLYTSDGEKENSIEMKKIDKSIKLKRKNSSILKAHITQYLQYDGDGNISLATGVVRTEG